MIKSIVFAIKTAWKADKGQLFYEVIYNLVKQFFNVFYGVYFLRTILVYIEEGKTIWPVLLILCFMLIVNIIFYVFNNHYKEVYRPCFDLRINSLIYEQIAEKAVNTPYDVFNHPDYLDQYQRVNDNTAANIQKTLNALGTMCGLWFALIMVGVYIVKVDMFALLLSVFPLFYSFFLGSKSEAQKFKRNQLLTKPGRKKEYARRLFYLPQYAKEIKTTNIASVIRSIYNDGVAETIEGIRKTGKKITLLSFAELCIGDVLIVMLPIAYVAVRMLTGAHFMIGDFVGIAQAISYFSWDIEWFFDCLLEVKSASLYIAEYGDYIGEKGDSGQPAEAGKEMPHGEWADECVLTLDNAGYQYPGSAQNVYALRNVNLTIRKGEKIAIVGENGAGKTTLAYLLMHLISCTEGQIKLNNRDIRDYADAALRQLFGVVLQDFNLYPLSVRKNICVNGALSDAVIWEAIAKMGLSECIPSLDVPLTREFSDEGLELSGGQQQKLALTRVLANPYPFIILDEPTSALDPISEMEIYQRLLEALSDQTLVFISHRMATARFVDRILFVKDGQIAEEGNHDALMERRGDYYELYTMQANQYRTDKGAAE